MTEEQSKLFEMFLITSKFQTATRNDVLHPYSSLPLKIKISMTPLLTYMHILNNPRWRTAYFFQSKYFEN